MFTILAADGKEYGPVTAGKVIEWMQTGRANAQTRIKRVNDTAWTTIGALPEFGGSDGYQSAPPPVAPPASAFVPAAPAPLTGSATEIAAGLNARAAALDIFGCLSRSFDLWKSNFLPLVGVTLLVMICQIVAGLIPGIGTFAGIFLNGVFYGGLYYYYLGKMRGQHREVADVFAGFTKSFVPLMLASLLTSVLIFAVVLATFGPLVVLVIRLFLTGAMPHSLGALPAIGPLALGGVALGCLGIIFLSVCWTFTFALVIDKGLGPWTAMEVSRRVVARQWFSVFFVLLLGWVLAMLGIIGFFIGVFFTIPLMFGAVLFAYEDLCNPPGPAA